MLNMVLTMMKLNDDYKDRGTTMVNVASLIKSTIENQKGSIESKGIKIELNMDKDVQIPASEMFLPHVFQNLLSNAIKFTKENGTISITSSLNNDSIEIDFTDDGIGLESGMETEIFNKFTKASRKGTNGESSMGIGLFLSKKIVESHHGIISAISEGTGKGTTFKVELPL